MFFKVSHIFRLHVRRHTFQYAETKIIGRAFAGKNVSWSKEGEVIIQITGVGPSGKTFIPQ